MKDAAKELSKNKDISLVIRYCNGEVLVFLKVGNLN